MNNEVNDFFDKMNDIKLNKVFVLTTMTVLMVKMKILCIYPDLRQLRFSSLIFFTCILKNNCFQYVSTKTLKINSTHLTTELFVLIINKIDHFSVKLVLTNKFKMLRTHSKHGSRGYILIADKN